LIERAAAAPDPYRLALRVELLHEGVRGVDALDGPAAEINGALEMPRDDDIAGAVRRDGGSPLS
jgi:hypothetical protein